MTHSASVHAQIIGQLLPIVWNLKGMTSGPLGTLG